MALEDGGDAGPQKKMKYPKSVIFIVSNEFCERFSYYGLRTVLSLYFEQILKYTENTATVAYHTFTMFAYFFPLLGAIIADSWLGKYRTILYLSMVYVVGQLLLSGSSTPWLHLPVEATTIIGLLLIALGTGGIKPCVSAFGGDQFKLPEQEAYLSTFFSLFYFSINSGSLLSTYLTPILRHNVSCFGNDTCYPLAFLVPCILMIVSVVIFFAGKRLYKIKPPEGNVIVQVSKCIGHAIARKVKSKEEREHWMDYADDKYERKTIEDIKAVLRVLKLFIPLPIFWALFDQQSSRWTFQAKRMDGEIFGYLIPPDQFQVVNPLFILILIPVFQWFVYPVIEKFLFINTPLRKLTVGGALAATSFVISGFVEFSLEPTYVVEPSAGLAQIRVFNTINCPAKIYSLAGTEPYQKYDLEALGYFEDLKIEMTGEKKVSYGVEVNCKGQQVFNITSDVDLIEEKSLSYLLTKTGLTGRFIDKIEKTKTGNPAVRAIVFDDSGKPAKVKVRVARKGNETDLVVDESTGRSEFKTVLHDVYDISVDGIPAASNLKLRTGGVYTINGQISADRKNVAINTVAVAQPNSVHMLWLLPQYIVITMGEIMFSITGLEFAFSQAPVSMKSLLSAGWLLTVAFGNLIVVIIAEAHFFKRQVFEFFLFAGLMYADMFVFAIMAMFYKYSEVAPSSDNSESDDINLQTKQGIDNETYSENL